jgi:hypothetical protein
MILLWSIVSASLVVAFAAWARARRTAARLTQLSEMYWELRYQQGELRVQMQRMSGETPAAPPEASASAPVGESFVPLSSLKR